MLTLDNFYKIIKVQYHTDILGSYCVIIVDRFIEHDRLAVLYKGIFIELNISGQCIKSSYNFLNCNLWLLHKCTTGDYLIIANEDTFVDSEQLWNILYSLKNPDIKLIEYITNTINELDKTF